MDGEQRKQEAFKHVWKGLAELALLVGKGFAEGTQVPVNPDLLEEVWDKVKSLEETQNPG